MLKIFNLTIIQILSINNSQTYLSPLLTYLYLSIENSLSICFLLFCLLLSVTTKYFLVRFLRHRNVTLVKYVWFLTFCLNCPSFSAGVSEVYRTRPRMDSYFKAAVCDLDKLLDDFELNAGLRLLLYWYCSITNINFALLSWWGHNSFWVNWCKFNNFCRSFNWSYVLYNVYVSYSLCM